MKVLKASVVAQGELARAIAERTGVRRVKDMYPQVAAAVVTAVVGTVLERWLSDGPSCSIVPLMRKAFDLVAGGFEQSRDKDGRKIVVHQHVRLHRWHEERWPYTGGNAQLFPYRLVAV